MKKILILFFITCTLSCVAQKMKPVSKTQSQIQSRVVGFLKWYRAHELDTTKHDYSLIKERYPDTAAKARIDRDGLEKYLQVFINSGYVSDTYIHSLRDYFLDIDALLAKASKTYGLVKIPGMDIDFVLQTFEPEAIFDNIKNIKVNKCDVIYNKALISIHLARHIDMLFILTKNHQEQWLIDYVGDDATDPQSFFRQ